MRGRMATFLFPGQGSQSPGMGQELAEAYPSARAVFEEADDALGFALSKVCFEGTEDELKRTEITQPAILTTSIASLRALQSVRPDLACSYAAGHSLGEWSALVAVGALAFADAVRLVRARGRLMQEAVPEGEGAMAAIIGLDSGEVVALAEGASSEVKAANFNSPEQTVISGTVAGVEAAEKAIAEKHASARVVRLPVSAPFHSPLMKPAADGLAAQLETITVHPMSAPVVTNVEAKPNKDHARVKSLLVEQVVAPVRWVEIVQYLVGAGETTALEIGPGKVLMGLVRRIDRNLGVKPVSDPASLEKALASLEG